LFNLPFNDLLYKAQQIHREHFNPNEVQLSTLLSIKTGGCPEDCGYCPQSVHYDTGVEASKMLDVDAVKAAAIEAKKTVPRVFAWAQHGANPKTATLKKWLN
jgi:biotin synthase